ncbi:hypothetical protein [Merismopedia glauca]|uniref:Uncharacterized protein n=1 Tax=Merismopedia glauca CCAP 1448/3 TaxID=1296344 RepID=A0A2T1C040_9CYAN|nr:hypothetical protein [Merismopedia glauca]PSB01639.1 hypothetical protein C7B64_17335 [Merismopedia glauca CCAP 1448/3]
MSAPKEEAIPVCPADRLRQPRGYANAQQAQIDLTAPELADLIWLMVQIKQSSQDSKVDPVSPPVAIADSKSVSPPVQILG